MSDINKNDNEEKNRTEEIQERINALQIQLNKKKQELEKIKKAIKKVNDLSSGNISKAKDSFNWTANKMTQYWNTTESSVRDKVQETLRKISNEFGSNGKMTSELPGLLAKANEKITELEEEIRQIEAEIEKCEAELRMSEV